MNRKQRTTLPRYTEFKQRTAIQAKMENLKWKQKQRYDETTKALKPLAKDDVVRKMTWIHGAEELQLFKK